MNLPIELPVFFHTDETASLTRVGVDVKVCDNEVRPLTFYSIDAISPYYDSFDNDKEYCKVYAAGDYFICNTTYKDLREQLK